MENNSNDNNHVFDQCILQLEDQLKAKEGNKVKEIDNKS